MPPISLNENDAFEEVRPKANIKAKISNADLFDSKQVRIAIRYDFLKLAAKTKYCFLEQTFENDEANLYFKRMADFAGKTIDELENGDYFRQKLHFRRNAICGNLKKLFDCIDPQICIGNPAIYHFALSDTKNVIADRKTNSRNARVYFMLGVKGEVFMLFFDPYHEINP